MASGRASAVSGFDKLARYHRLEVRGLDNIPLDGPALLVGNHNGGLNPVDGLWLVHYYRSCGYDRPIYILAHDSKEAGLASFEAFRADPDWIKAKTESEKDGSLTIEPRSEGVKSVYMTATDFSPIQ